jgi:hypothetical protein
MRIKRHSIVVKLLVWIFTLILASAAMIYFQTNPVGLCLAIGILLAGGFVYAFVLVENKRN